MQRRIVHREGKKWGWKNNNLIKINAPFHFIYLSIHPSTHFFFFFFLSTPAPVLIRNLNWFFNYWGCGSSLAKQRLSGRLQPGGLRLCITAISNLITRISYIVFSLTLSFIVFPLHSEAGLISHAGFRQPELTKTFTMMKSVYMWQYRGFSIRRHEIGFIVHVPERSRKYD